MTIRAHSGAARHGQRTATAHSAQAVLLIGEGSPQLGGGAEMIRMTAHLRDIGVAPQVIAGFTHHQGPTFTQGVAQCALRGASDVVVVPYALAASHFVVELPALALAAESTHPDVRLRLAAPLGDHPALARLVLQRALEADYTAAHPYILGETGRPYLDNGPPWQPLYATQQAGLLLVADDATPAARHALTTIARRIRARAQYLPVAIRYLSPQCDSLADAVARFAAHSIQSVVVLPYSLHLGASASQHFEATLAAARAQHPSVNLIRAQHLGFDRLLVAAVADRVVEALAVPAALLQCL